MQFAALFNKEPRLLQHWRKRQGLNARAGASRELDSLEDVLGCTGALTIASDPAEMKPVQEALVWLLVAHRYSEREVFGIKLALEEALVNAIKHGNRMDPSRKVRIAYRILPERLDVCITDEGEGFDPDELPDPTDVEYLERPCGRGVLLMRHYMTEVSFNDRGNSVRLSKVRGDRGERRRPERCATAEGV